METVEVVIKIPKEEYDYIQLYGSIKPFSAKQIINGTVLPKGHGRLIDADKLKERYLYMSNDDTAIEGMEYVTKGMIENAEVVIEADKEAENDTGRA